MIDITGMLDALTRDASPQTLLLLLAVYGLLSGVLVVPRWTYNKLEKTNEELKEENKELRTMLLNAVGQTGRALDVVEPLVPFVKRSPK